MYLDITYIDLYKYFSNFITNICSGYWVESLQANSNEYPQPLLFVAKYQYVLVEKQKQLNT